MDTPSLLPADAHCLDCGAPQTGRYCQDCGQQHLDGRLTLRSVWRDFAERFLKFERGLPATARLAVADPGRLAREYVRGRRRRYVNPVSFLLIGSAVAVLLIPLYASPERLLNDPGMGAQPGAAAGLDLGIRIAGGDPAAITPEQRERILAEAAARQAEFVPVYISTVNQLYSVFSVVLALAFAGFLKLFFSGRDQTDTFAETLVLGLFFAGTYAALSAIAASAVAQFDGTILLGMAVTTGLLVAGAAWAAAGFYHRTWGAAALGAVSGIAALVIYTVAIMAIALPIVILKLA